MIRRGIKSSVSRRTFLLQKITSKLDFKRKERIKWEKCAKTTLFTPLKCDFVRVQQVTSKLNGGIYGTATFYNSRKNKKDP
jgi:hypothetical protein